MIKCSITFFTKKANNLTKQQEKIMIYKIALVHEKGELSMENVYDVLAERGFIEQSTNAEEVRELLGRGPVTFISVLMRQRTVCMSVILFR